MGLGNILKTLRNSYHYSQQYVADCLNISRNAYIAWENGETRLSMGKLLQICEVYQISLQELLINGDRPKLNQKPRLRKQRVQENSLESIELKELELFQ